MVLKKVVKKIIPKKVLPIKKKVIVKKKVVKKPAVKKEVVKVPEKIGVKGVQDILNIVGNKDYFEIYKLVLGLDKEFFTKGFSGSFDKKKEVKDFFKERIFDFLNGEYSELKSQISQLRKKGNEVMYIDYEVLTLPLKKRMLKAEFNLKSFLKVKEIIDFARKELKVFILEQEKKEKEKEEREKLKEAEARKKKEKDNNEKEQGKVVRKEGVKKKIVKKKIVKKEEK